MSTSENTTQRKFVCASIFESVNGQGVDKLDEKEEEKELSEY